MTEVNAAASKAGRRRSAAIYGTILTAAVIAAGGNVLTTQALEVTVLVTLVIYWLADEYSVLLGEHIHAGKLPSIRQIRSSLATSWPMVSASFIPLIALALIRVLGASPSAAAESALVVAIALLLAEGLAAGRAAGLRGLRLTLVTLLAGLLGGAMVVLKSLIHAHH
jgi:hypothetical protein